MSYSRRSDVQNKISMDLGTVAVGLGVGGIHEGLPHQLHDGLDVMRRAHISFGHVVRLPSARGAALAWSRRELHR